MRQSWRLTPFGERRRRQGGKEATRWRSLCWRVLAGSVRALGYARDRLHVAGVVVLVAASMSVAVAFGGNDSYGDSRGFYSCARILAAGRLTEPIRPVPGLKFPQHRLGLLTPPEFHPRPTHGGRAEWVLNRFIGWPLHMAIASKIFGWYAGPIVLLALFTSGSVVLCYLLGIGLRLPGPWALVAAALVAINPIVVLYSLVPMNDVASMFWCLVAACSACWSRRWRALALLAGFAIGVAVLVRPPNTVLLPALLVLLPWRKGAFVRFFGAGAVVAAAKLLSNYAVFHTPLGVDLEAGKDTIAWSFVARGLSFYGHWFSRMLGPLLLLIGGAGFVWLIARRDRRSFALAIWIVSVVLFYSADRNAREGWWLLRYLMPALPAFFLGAALATHEFCRFLLRPGKLRAPRRVVAVAAAGVWLWAFFASIRGWRDFDVPNLIARQPRVADVAAWMRERLPDGAVILASHELAPTVYFHTDRPLLALYAVADAAELSGIRVKLRRNGTPLVAMLVNDELPQLHELAPNRWVYMGSYGIWSLWSDR